MCSEYISISVLNCCLYALIFSVLFKKKKNYCCSPCRIQTIQGGMTQILSLLVCYQQNCFAEFQSHVSCKSTGDGSDACMFLWAQTMGFWSVIYLWGWCLAEHFVTGNRVEGSYWKLGIWWRKCFTFSPTILHADKWVNSQFHFFSHFPK